MRVFIGLLSVRVNAFVLYFAKKKRISESFLFPGKGPELVIMTQNVINVYF